MDQITEHFDRISALIEEHSCLSARWLASALKIDVDSSAKLLASYKSDRSSALFASYLLTGASKTRVGYLFRIVPEDRIEAESELFACPPAVQLYSLQQNRLDDVVALQLHEFDQTQASDVFAQSINLCTVDYVAHFNGSIAMGSSQEVKNVGERILRNPHQALLASSSTVAASNNKSYPKMPSSYKAPASSSSSLPISTLSKTSLAKANSFFSKNPTSFKSKDVTFDAQSAASSQGKVTSAREAPSVAAPLAALAQKSAPVDSLKKTETSSLSSPSEAKSAEEVVDSDEEWDCSFTASRKRHQATEKTRTVMGGDSVTAAEGGKDKENLPENANIAQKPASAESDSATSTKNAGSKKRKIIEPEDDEDDESEGQVGDGSQVDGGGEFTGKKVSKKNVLKRGAMDDYFEDVAIAAFKEEQANAVTEGKEGHSIVKPKKTAQKLVEKVHMDERGFLVTTMVYETVEVEE